MNAMSDDGLVVTVNKAYDLAVFDKGCRYDTARLHDEIIDICEGLRLRIRRFWY